MYVPSGILSIYRDKYFAPYARDLVTALVAHGVEHAKLVVTQDPAHYVFVDARTNHLLGGLEEFETAMPEPAVYRIEHILRELRQVRDTGDPVELLHLLEEIRADLSPVRWAACLRDQAWIEAFTR